MAASFVVASAKLMRWDHKTGVTRLKAIAAWEN